LVSRGVFDEDSTAMSARSDPVATAPRAAAADLSQVFQQGVVAGLLGAATIAVWFLILDAIEGRPLHTPTVLGTALFARGENLAMPERLPVALDMVLMFTWVHGLVFIMIGGLTSWLLSQVERHPSIGTGILILFIVCEFGFVVGAMLFAEPLLHALAWPAVVVANLLAASAMGAYFWFRHPTLRIPP
jgi:hypothetical protein